jgi:hypothetical protein
MCVVQRESGPQIYPLPELMTSGFEAEKPCYLCTIEQGGRWGWRSIFLYGDSRAALAPLSAALADVGRYLSAASLPSWIAKELPSVDRDEMRWLHVLLAVCWHTGLGGINALKAVQVHTGELLLHIPLNSLPECRQEADTAAQLSSIPDPPNWFTCSVDDLAGSSVAAINWLLLGDHITSTPPAGEASAATAGQGPDYIDLDQAAALVNRSKRTLERRLSQMPPPAVQGTGGKKSEWLYCDLRPWLEKEFEKKLPDRPPHVLR